MALPVPAPRASPRWRLAGAFAAVALVGALGACSIPGVYVVEDRDTVASSGTQAFDPTAFVDGIWAGKVLPAFTSGPPAAGTVIAGLTSDRDATDEKYGRQAGSGAPFTFAVQGTGVVEDVDTSGAVGRAKLRIDGVPRGTDVYLAIGPAFVGTAVRDSLPFIDFSQFTNQLDYADVATGLNTKVKTDVIGKVDLDALKGKKVAFSGAFAVLDPTALVLTPVVLTVAP